MIGMLRICCLVLPSFLTLVLVTAGQNYEKHLMRESLGSIHENDTDHENIHHVDHLRTASNVESDRTSDKLESVFIESPSNTGRISTHTKKPELSATTELTSHTAKHQVKTVTPIVRYPVTAAPKLTNPSVPNNTGTIQKPPTKTRLMLKRYKSMKNDFLQRMHHSVKLYNASHHLRRRGHLHFFNQFVYELKTLRSCFYQFVKKGCTLSVFYQSLDTEPLTVYVSDQHHMVLHDNYLQKSGNFILTAKESNIYGICLENFSWDVKKVFLSIRVESHQNSRVMIQPHHPVAHTLLGHIRILEVEVRSMQAQIWDKKARAFSNEIAENDKIAFALWITWLIVLSTLLIYVLQAMEIHRVVRSAELRYCGGAEYIRIALRES